MSKEKKSHKVLLELAKTSTDQMVLEDLSNNPDINIRRAVVRNKAVSLKTMKKILNNISNSYYLESANKR